jgi:S1-C subfamily serine protease
MSDLYCYQLKLLKKLNKWPALEFTPTKTQEKRARNLKVSLGIMPDYTVEGQGLRIDGISPGKNAERIGLKEGDFIIGIGDAEITDISTYMSALSEYNQGDSTRVKVRRGEEILEFDLTFE